MLMPFDRFTLDGSEDSLGNMTEELIGSMQMFVAQPVGDDWRLYEAGTHWVSGTRRPSACGGLAVMIQWSEEECNLVSKSASKTQEPDVSTVNSSTECNQKYLYIGNSTTKADTS